MTASCGLATQQSVAVFGKFRQLTNYEAIP